MGPGVQAKVKRSVGALPLEMKARTPTPAMHSSTALPIHNGVGPSRVVLPAGDWPTVLAFLCERFPLVSANQWLQRCATARVLQADGTAVSPQTTYRPFQSIFYYREVPHEPTLPEPATVLFEDEHLLVADKPHFMPVTPGGRYLQNSLLVQLKRTSSCASLTPIHRIDRETAGVVVFSKRASERAAYHALFREQRVQKYYLAVAGVDPS